MFSISGNITLLQRIACRRHRNAGHLLSLIATSSLNEWPECPDARISQSGGPSEGKEAVELSWTYVKKQAAQQQQA